MCKTYICVCCQNYYHFYLYFLYFILFFYPALSLTTTIILLLSRPSSYLSFRIILFESTISTFFVLLSVNRFGWKHQLVSMWLPAPSQHLHPLATAGNNWVLLGLVLSAIMSNLDHDPSVFTTSWFRWLFFPHTQIKRNWLIRKLLLKHSIDSGVVITILHKKEYYYSKTKLTKLLDTF